MPIAGIRFSIDDSTHVLTKNAPPALIMHGSIDEMVAVTQSGNLAARLAEFGVP